MTDGGCPMLDIVYRDARRRVTELANTLDEQQLLAPVPATPNWVVHQVLCHLVGCAVDSATNRVDGAPDDAWTARHVAERATSPVAALLTEWEHIGPTIEKGLVGVYFTGPNIAADIICHEADLREALGLAPVDRKHWHDPFLEVMMLLLGSRLRNIATVEVRDDAGHQWTCGSAEPAISVRAAGYELLRAMFSRRSRRQIAAWEWTPTPPGSVIDSFGVFGPRDDDQPRFGR